MNKNQELLEACTIGDLKKVKTLIASGADINYQNVESFNFEDYFTFGLESPRHSLNTPLMKAAKNGHLDVVIFLVKNGADVNLKNRFAQTAVWRAIEKNHTTIAIFLEENGADVKYIRNFETTLMWAAWHNNLKLIDFLLNKGIDINYSHWLAGDALLWAAWSNNKEVVQYLVTKGATVRPIEYYNRNESANIFFGKMGTGVKQYLASVAGTNNPMPNSLHISNPSDEDLPPTYEEAIVWSNNSFQSQNSLFMPKPSAPSM